MSRVCGNVSAHIGTIRAIYINKYFHLYLYFTQMYSYTMDINVFHNSSCNITNFSSCEDIHNLT